MFTFDSPYERIPTQERKVPGIKGDMDQLTRDAILAERKGISYGKLMAQRIEKQGMSSLADVREKKRRRAVEEEGNCKGVRDEDPAAGGDISGILQPEMPG